MVKTFYNAINKITLTQVAVKIFTPLHNPRIPTVCVPPHYNIGGALQLIKQNIFELVGGG